MYGKILRSLIFWHRRGKVELNLWVWFENSLVVSEGYHGNLYLYISFNMCTLLNFANKMQVLIRSWKNKKMATWGWHYHSSFPSKSVDWFCVRMFVLFWNSQPVSMNDMNCIVIFIVSVNLQNRKYTNFLSGTLMLFHVQFWNYCK